MGFVAEEESTLFNYIIGDVYTKQDNFNGIYDNGKYGLSISCNRYYYLEELNEKCGNLKVACRDITNNGWSRWNTFPGLLWQTTQINRWATSSKMSAAIDVHRSVLPNEIVIESDYPTYEENYDASKIIGAILEHKGFSPHYYYSGNKSIHIHVFLDWNVLHAVYWDEFENTPKKIGSLIETDIKNFQKKFMDWLRKKMISCWDMKAREFDEELVRASHLIRAELSKNKKGFKTFLGYSHKDMSFIPYICNESNMIYPRLGKIRLSNPSCMKELLEEFQESRVVESKIERIKKKNKPLSRWIGTSEKKQLRLCIKAILSDDFSKVNDGFKRGMFFLVNELRDVFGDETAKIMANDWNKRIGNKVPKSEIDYRFKIKHYTISCERIHKFLKEIGIEIEEKCNRKVYK